MVVKLDSNEKHKDCVEGTEITSSNANSDTISEDLRIKLNKKKQKTTSLIKANLKNGSSDGQNCIQKMIKHPKHDCDQGVRDSQRIIITSRRSSENYENESQRIVIMNPLRNSEEN